LSFRLPNGSTVDLAATYGSPVTITAITNANPAVVTAAGHGLSDGDYVEITSGWLRANGRIFRVDNSTTDTFELEGLDTTNTDIYPAGAGVGSLREILTVTQVAQITDVATTGGDQQFLTFGFLEENDDRQIPTTRSPQTITFTVADDPTQAFVPVAEAADQTREPNGVFLNLPDGSKILYNGYLSFSETPSLARNNLMVRTMTFSLSGRPVRYNV
jgi:hypothetical protein